MKLIAIGDTHGRPVWKEILKKEKDADHIVFIGDYFDTWTPYTAREQIDNFLEIMLLHERKKKFPKVATLMGNHDFHYLSQMGERYSGFQSDDAPLYEKAVMESLPYLQMAFEYHGWLLTHAGVTKTWMEDNKLKGNNPALEINTLFNTCPDSFKFNRKDSSGYGDHKSQGPIWVRPDALLSDMFQPKQIVGHTKVKLITYHEPEELILIDAIGARQYLKITDKGPETMTI